MNMENLIRFVVIVFAVVLFVVGTFLYLQQATASATSAMGFVFLSVFVLTISNFKRIKGFGFEAEMWDEKQMQAAKLIDRLELLSRATSEQLALIASRLGLWTSGFTNPETADLLDKMRQVLQSTGTSDVERKNILAPLHWRIGLNYVNAAREMIDRELRNDREEVTTAYRNISDEERPKLQEKMITIDDIISRFRNGPDVLDMVERKTIQPLQKLVSEAPYLAAKANLVNDIKEIAVDMSYFEIHGTLRRKIDWMYLHK